jgi:hypothetical protein
MEKTWAQEAASLFTMALRPLRHWRNIMYATNVAVVLVNTQTHNTSAVSILVACEL